MRELIVRKPEAILVHERPPDEAVNHKTAARSNAFMGPDPSWSVTHALGRMIEGNMPRYFFHLRLPSVD